MPRHTPPRPKESPAIPLSGPGFGSALSNPFPVGNPLEALRAPSARRAQPAAGPSRDASWNAYTPHEAPGSAALTHTIFWGFMASVGLGVLGMCYAVMVM